MHEGDVGVIEAIWTPAQRSGIERNDKDSEAARFDTLEQGFRDLFALWSDVMEFQSNFKRQNVFMQILLVQLIPPRSIAARLSNALDGPGR